MNTRVGKAHKIILSNNAGQVFLSAENVCIWRKVRKLVIADQDGDDNVMENMERVWHGWEYESVVVCCGNTCECITVQPTNRRYGTRCGLVTN